MTDADKAAALSTLKNSAYGRIDMNGELYNIKQVGCLSFELMTVLLTRYGKADRDVCRKNSSVNLT